MTFDCYKKQQSLPHWMSLYNNKYKKPQMLHCEVSYEMCYAVFDSAVAQ